MVEILNTTIPKLENLDVVAAQSFHALLGELRKIIHNHASSKVSSANTTLCIVAAATTITQPRDLLAACCS
jgi:hypothetical protein